MTITPNIAYQSLDVGKTVQGKAIENIGFYTILCLLPQLTQTHQRSPRVSLKELEEQTFTGCLEGRLAESAL